MRINHGPPSALRTARFQADRESAWSWVDAQPITASLVTLLEKDTQSKERAACTDERACRRSEQRQPSRDCRQKGAMLILTAL